MQEPSFNVWTIIFLISAAQGLLLALVFGFSKYRPNRLLAMVLFLFALTMTEYVMFWTGYMVKWPHWNAISVALPWLFGPLLWMYFRSVFEQRPIDRRDAWHLAPFVVFFFVYLPYYLLPASKKTAIMLDANLTFFPLWVGALCVWGSILHLIGYCTWHYIYFRRQPTVGQTNRWATSLNTCMLGYALAYASYYILVRFDFFTPDWDYHISLAMTTFIYLIAIAGYLQPAVFQGYRMSESAPGIKYRNSGLTEAAIQSLFDKLSHIMETEYLYRNPDLNLDTLAHRLNASKHHVSQVINACSDGTFFDYVNRLRIEEAKHLLAEHPRSDFNIIEVAYAVGFNNKVSFNTAFKKVTGITPTAFRHQNGRTDMPTQQPGNAR